MYSTRSPSPRRLSRGTKAEDRHVLFGGAGAVEEGDEDHSSRERPSLFGADEALRGGDRGEDNEGGEGDDHEEVHRADKIVRVETQGRVARRRGRGTREVEGRPDVPL